MAAIDSDDLVTDAEDLGEIEEIDAIAALVELDGCRIADIGCGSGRVTRQLVARGARATGVEPDPVQAARNRKAEPEPGLDFVEAAAEELPFADGELDAVLFSYSLHHVPDAVRHAALDEARRVLKPSGTLLVMEPLLSGTLEAVYRPFHDESAVRRAAYAAVLDHAAPRFRRHREVRFSGTSRYDAFATFLEQMTGTTYADFGRDKVDTPEVRAAFEAGRAGDGYAFTEHVRINALSEPAAR